jgi:hypothetical protein
MTAVLEAKPLLTNRVYSCPFVIPLAAMARAFTKARTERSISFCVVAQSQTLIRITALPCQVDPPIRAVERL